jgi:hypothetical protein
MEYQKEQRFKTVEKLGCLENEIKVKLEKSCEESLQYFKEENRIQSKTDDMND